MKRRPITMVCVLATGEPGGAELSAATHLSHRPPWIRPYAVIMSGGRMFDTARADGIPAVVLPLRSSSATGLLDFTRRLGGTLRAVAPDLLYAVGNKAILASLPAARTLGIPCLWYKVDLVMPRWQVTLVSRSVRRVVSLSRAAGAPVSSSRLSVIYPPVRLSARFAVTGPRPEATLACFGRLEPTKGQHHLISAAALLRKRFPEVKVLLAGGSPAYAGGYGSELRTQAERMGVPLEVTGHVERVEPLLARATVYVQPSFPDQAGRGGEGLGIALAEASWAGLPVVASDTGGIPEVVCDGVTGTLVPPADPAALAQAIGAYLDDPEVARRAGAAGARFARERFAPKPGAARLFDVIGEVVAR